MIVFFFASMTFIDQNWDSPGHVVQRLAQLNLPDPSAFLRAALMTFVPTAALYLVLLSAFRVVEQRGWLVQPKTGDVTVPITGVEAITGVGSVTARATIAGRGTVGTPPGMPEQALRAVSNAIYKPVVVVSLAGQLTFTGQLSTVKITKQPPAPKDESEG